ncbi:MAG TPA: potassium transporter [Opitutae bacterium]|nr:potassium transporter [Opitutae bacterium]|tara:strand:+ start:1325 stop:2227 length:903 start_codon:yes stop_codon:yes gene_type:complete
MSEACLRISNSKAFQRFIILTIVLAGVVVGVQTYAKFAERHKEILEFMDGMILVVFSLEVIIKVAAEGKKPLRYFNNPWNVFDFIIVAACLLEPVLPIDGAFLPVLRLARILRVLRLVTTIPKLQVLVTCLLKSLPSMFYVSVLLGLLFYVYGTMAVFLYGENDPIHFRNLQTSVLSLFRVVTLEDWTDVMYINMYGSDNYGYSDQDLARWEPSSQASPLGAAIFFVSFVLIGTMIVLNLVIGVIMNSMDESNAEMSIQREISRRRESPDPVRDGVQDLHQRLEELSSEMKVIKKMLEEK